MEALAADLFSGHENEEELMSFLNQWELSSPADNEFTSPSIWECFEETPSTNASAGSSCLDSPTTPLPNTGGPVTSPTTATASWVSSYRTPKILSFGSPSSPADLQEQLCESPKPMDQVVTTTKAARRTRPVLPNHEHVIAERKRREKLTQKLIALSAIIPGLKRQRDKVSILTDAISYMKQMEQKLKSLEERVPSANSQQLSCSSGDETVPAEIEVRVSGSMSFLIKIQCEMRKGALVKALTEIESLHLHAITTSALPFSNRFLHITVMAQVEEGFSVTVKDLVKKLRSAFRDSSSSSEEAKISFQGLE